MSAQHTPAPWEFREDGDANHYCILAGNRWLISFLHNGEQMTAQQIANAKFIVRACTAHDELLEAAQQAEHWLGELRSGDQIRPVEILRVLRAAIAKAEGLS